VEFDYVLVVELELSDEVEMVDSVLVTPSISITLLSSKIRESRAE
jgi:hypothetical protein